MFHSLVVYFLGVACCSNSHSGCAPSVCLFTCSRLFSKKNMQSMMLQDWLQESQVPGWGDFAQIEYLGPSSTTGFGDWGGTMGTGKWPCMVNSEEFWKKHTHTHSLKTSPVCKGFRNAGWKWVKSTDGNVMHNLCMDSDCNPQIQHGTEGDGIQEESPRSGSHARVWCSLAGL